MWHFCCLSFSSHWGNFHLLHNFPLYWPRTIFYEYLTIFCIFCHSRTCGENLRFCDRGPKYLRVLFFFLKTPKLLATSLFRERSIFLRQEKTRNLEIPDCLSWLAINLERFNFLDASRNSAMIGDHSRYVETVFTFGNVRDSFSSVPVH